MDRQVRQDDAASPVRRRAERPRASSLAAWLSLSKVLSQTFPQMLSPGLASLIIIAAAALGAVAPVRGGPPEDQFTLASGHYTKQRWDQALVEFQRMLDSHPLHPLSDIVPFFQGEATHQLRRFEEARQHYANYLRQQPEGRYVTHAQFRLCECLVLTGQPAAALAELDQYLERHAQDTRQGFVQLYRGQCLLELQRPDEARQAYLVALADLTRTSSAPASEGQSVRDARDSGEVADAAVREASDKCRFGLAQSLQQLGELHEARRFYEFLERGVGSMADDALLQIATLHLEQQQPAEAWRAVESFRRRFADSACRPQLELLAARIRLQRGEPLEAADELLRTVQDDTPQVPGVALLYQAGRAYHAAGDAPRADECFAQLLRRWPAAELAAEALHARIVISQPDDTETLCRQLLRSYPDSPRRGETQMLLSETLLRLGRFADAAETLAELSAQEHASERVRYLLMLSQLGAGEPAQAVAVAQAIDVARLDAPLRSGMLSAHATALGQLGRHAEAADVLRQCLQDCPPAERSAFAARRAVALAQINQIEEAMEMLTLVELQWPQRLVTARYVAARAQSVGATAEATVIYQLLIPDGDRTLADSVSLCQTLWDTGDHDGAEQQLHRLWSQHPAAAETQQLTLRRGRQWEQAGRPSEALRCYEWLAEHGRGGACQAAQFRAARLYEQTGRDREAVALLRPLADAAAAEIRQPDTGQPDTGQPDTGQPAAPADAVLYHLAWALLDLDQRDEAQRVFAQLADATHGGPLRDDAIYRVARLELENGRAETAAARLQRLSLSLSPDQPLARHTLLLSAHAAAAQRQWQPAAQALERLLAMPETPASMRADATFFLGEALYRQRRFEPAGQRLDEAAAAARRGGTAPSWLPLAELRRAQLLAQQQQWRAAGDAAERLLAEFPEFGRRQEADYLVGRSLAARARFTEARNAYQRVLDSPGAQGATLAAKTQWMIGETYMHQRDYEAAIRAYHQVELLHQHPEWQALALLQAAKCHQLAARPQQAAALLRQLRQEFPHTRAAREAGAEGGAEPSREATSTAARTGSRPGRDEG